MPAGPQRLLEVLNEKNRYVNETRVVAVTGLYQTKMNTIVVWRGENKSIKEHIKSEARVDFIEHKQNKISREVVHGDNKV